MNRDGWNPHRPETHPALRPQTGCAHRFTSLATGRCFGCGEMAHKGPATNVNASGRRAK